MSENWMAALHALEHDLVCPKCRAHNTTAAATNQIHVINAHGETVCDGCGHAAPIQLFPRRPQP